jgi:hypothetical protein
MLSRHLWQAGFASAFAVALLAGCGGGAEPAATAPAPSVALQPIRAAQSVDPAAPATALTSAPADPERAVRTTPGHATNKVYIVQLAEMPVTAYTGTVKGLAATKPRAGQKIDPNSPAVVNYMAHLATRHDAVLASVGGGRKLYSYGYVFDGFAAELTDAQAAKIALDRNVLAVTKDELRSVDTSSTPTFLGLNAPDGIWSKATGENVIVGMVDTGIWPEHASFSDRTGVNGNATQDGKLSYQQIPGWHGRCIPGDQFTGTDCNQKLIGARYYNSGFGGNDGVIAQFPFEFNSPRDWEGHGSHTASTAAGNGGVQPTGPAASFGPISGMAPRARIAAYKVCWGGTAGGCFASDSVAAIDQAVADGVDVINFSISGSSTNFRDPVEIAFLFAADAGVFVAASAGNTGPATSTVAHPGPWLTTVAAGTHNRNLQGTVTLGNGATYTGASIASAVPSAPLIDSTAAGLPGADATQVALCYSSADGGAVLDPAKVAGKIVVCDRGVTARVNKSLAVKEAGGVGMILVNTSASSLNADFHFVPTVHLQNTDRAAVKAYAGTTAPTAMINQSQVLLNAAAPFTASFSSRGPLRAGDGNLLKPDIIAPGQDILAAVAPPGNAGRLFDLYSGTSMSSPHIAGIAALFKQLHPAWSPMAIKSALMTSAGDVLDDVDTNPDVIFRQGAGHVQPNPAMDPGLVFDSRFADWLGFLCGTQLPVSFCANAGVPVIQPSNFNAPSIAIGALGGIQAVTRKVTNVGSADESYTASFTGLDGFTVAMAPATLVVPRGATRSFTLTFTRTAAPLNSYTGGQFTLNGDKSHKVRIPIVARPVALAAPVEVTGSYNVTFGYDGTFGVAARGLVPATITAGTVTQDPDQTFDPADASGTVAISVVVPAGQTYARFALFDADVAPGSDIDMYVYRGTTLVGSSTNGGSQEEVSLVDPVAATYTVYLHGWGLPSGTSPYRLHTWQLGTAAAGNMTVTAPTTATTGGSGAVAITTSGLAAGTKYLGSVAYSGSTGMPNPTIVKIQP